jgi:phage portal protein BeeE
MDGVTSPYRQHVWVYSCINAIAQNIAAVPMNFYAGTKKNKRLVETGPLVKVFETQNPLMSGAQLIEATMIFLGITGEAFYILDRSTPPGSPQRNLDLPSLPIRTRSRSALRLNPWLALPQGVITRNWKLSARVCFLLFNGR